MSKQWNFYILLPNIIEKENWTYPCTHQGFSAIFLVILFLVLSAFICSNLRFYLLGKACSELCCKDFKSLIHATTKDQEFLYFGEYSRYKKKNDHKNFCSPPISTFIVRIKFLFKPCLGPSKKDHYHLFHGCNRSVNQAAGPTLFFLLRIWVNYVTG